NLEKLENREEIQTLINEFEKKTRTRQFQILDLVEAIEDFEKKFDFLPKRLKKGIMIEVGRYEYFAGRYKGIPKATFVKIIWDNGFYIVDITRENCEKRGQKTKNIKYVLPKKNSEEIKERFLEKLDLNNIY